MRPDSLGSSQSLLGELLSICLTRSFMSSALFLRAFINLRDGDGQCFEPRSIDEERGPANGQAGSVRSNRNETGLVPPSRNPDSPTSASVHASASVPLVSPSTPSDAYLPPVTSNSLMKVTYSSFENRDKGDQDPGSPV